MNRAYRFFLFPLSLFGLFKPEKLVAIIKQGSQGGYRLLKRELSIETKRFMLFLKTICFGLVFERDAQNPEQEYDWRIVQYKTRLLSKTVDLKRFNRTLAQGTQGGYELYYALKYPAKFLFVFPREAYFFIFRKPQSQQARQYEYSVHQTPYRFFSKTLDEGKYTADLNAVGSDKQLKITFRDERRKLGFVQPAVISIWERAA
jgi:hypothetical protein